jgi:hypothetical protein
MRRVVSGQFELSLSAEKAFGFFTPEGEKEWVPGWIPAYPAGEPSETPGTVFTTNVGDADTVWLIQEIDRVGCTAGYSRVTPGHHAGTVHVSCEDISDGRSVVSVTYDMSVLPGGDPAALDAYDDASFKAMMNDWSQAVSRKL